MRVKVFDLHFQLPQARVPWIATLERDVLVIELFDYFDLGRRGRLQLLRSAGQPLGLRAGLLSKDTGAVFKVNDQQLAQLVIINGPIRRR